MARKTLNYITAYVLFTWGFAWRVFVISILTALLTGVMLAIMSIANNWPPTFIEDVAPLMGLPITLLVSAYVMWKQILKLKRRAITA